MTEKCMLCGAEISFEEFNRFNRVCHVCYYVEEVKAKDAKISDLTAGKEQAERELQVALKALELAVSNIYGQESHIYPTCDCEYCMAYSETRYWLDCAKRDIAEVKE